MSALYKKIYKDIKNKIELNILKEGDNIPSEAQLRMKYNCSRDTVRKATSMLEQTNYIEKSRGKQATVKSRNKYKFPTSRIESFKELKDRINIDAQTILVSLDNDYKEKNQHTYFFEKCVQVKRVRQLDGEKVVLDIDYFDANIVKGLTKSICKKSIYEFIETKLGIEIGYSQKIVTVEKPTSEELKYLDITEDDFLVCVASNTFTKDNVIFQSTISKHRYDKFIFESYAIR